MCRTLDSPRLSLPGMAGGVWWAEQLVQWMCCSVLQGREASPRAAPGRGEEWQRAAGRHCGGVVMCDTAQLPVIGVP